MKQAAVLVTGATGLVGFNLVQHLSARAYRVSALTRPSSNRQALAALVSGNLAMPVAELSDTPLLAQAMRGYDVVVHAAGMVNPHGSRRDIFAVNVQAACNALAAAIEAGVKQFVHISSLSVITARRDQFDVDENAPLQKSGEAYADSKVEAELRLSAEIARGRIAVTILRPGFIYGADERSWLPYLIDSIKSGKAVLIDGGRKQTNVIYVGNLCRAIEASLLNENAFGQVYNLTDGESVSKKQLFDAIADRLELPRVTRSIPAKPARLACELVSLLAPFLSSPARRKLSRFSRAAFRLAGINQGFSILKAERDLSYIDRISFAEGMDRTLAGWEETMPAWKDSVRSSKVWR